MPVWTALLWWPLRKAAIIPGVAISVAGLAALVGTADLAAATVRLVLPGSGAVADADKRRFSKLVSVSVAATVSGAIIAARELLLRPTVPPPPPLPVTAGPVRDRIVNAYTVSKHVLTHYPYRFRFATAFVAGGAAGAAYAISDWAYNRGVKGGRVGDAGIVVSAPPSHAAGDGSGDASDASSSAVAPSVAAVAPSVAAVAPSVAAVAPSVAAVAPSVAAVAPSVAAVAPSVAAPAEAVTAATTAASMAAATAPAVATLGRDGSWSSAAGDRAAAGAASATGGGDGDEEAEAVDAEAEADAFRAHHFRAADASSAGAVREGGGGGSGAAERPRLA